MMYSQVGRAAREFFAHKMGYDFETVDQRWANLSFEGRRYLLFAERS
jgi:hypothetical protein